MAAFSHTRGQEPFREAFRVLRLGGALHSCDMVVDPADRQRLPEGFRAECEERSPGFASGIVGHLERVGFSIASRQTVPGRALNAEQDGTQAHADKYGVALRVVFEYVKARRPGIVGQVDA